MCGKSKENSFSARLGWIAGYCWRTLRATALVMATGLVAMVTVPAALAMRAAGMERDWPLVERLLVATETAVLAIKAVKATTKPLPPLHYSPVKEPWTANGPKD